jgi:hypothetical protein
LDAAYRGNPDGSWKQSVEFAFAAMFLSIDSYLGALDVGTAGLDARDAVAYNHFQIGTVRKLGTCIEGLMNKQIAGKPGVAEINGQDAPRQRHAHNAGHLAG